MNSEIESILEGITDADGTEVPFYFMQYTGDAETYITYQALESVPSMHTDDTLEEINIYYDIDIFSKNNYRKIIKEVYERMINAGWMFTGDSDDIYEEDTQYYHKTMSFIIERSIDQWLTLD